MHRHVLTTVISAALFAGPVAVSTAAAQTSQAPERRGIEVATLGIWTGPATFGTSAALLTKGDGGDFRLFESENGLASGFGVELSVALPLVDGLAAELGGRVSTAQLYSSVFADFEDVPSMEITERLVSFVADASLLWTLAPASPASLFIRGGAGWMREVAGGGLFSEDGAVAHAGVGVKYWWGQGPQGPPGRLGLRVEGRVDARYKGISLGDEDIVFAPAAAAGLIFRF